jgi:hypothetical protein
VLTNEEIAAILALDDGGEPRVDSDKTGHWYKLST